MSDIKFKEGKVYNIETKHYITIIGPTYKSLIKKKYVVINNIIYAPDSKEAIEFNSNPNIPNVPIAPTIVPPVINNIVTPIPNIVVEVVNNLTEEDLQIKLLGHDDYIIDEIIHISDIHIPLHLHLNRKEEYISVFNKLYETIRKREGNKVIVITGDLLHVKLTLEAETIILARNFIESLSIIAPTIIIIGNHDFLENNLQREDALTAICHGLRAHCLKYTGVYKLGNILFAFSSLFDKKFIKRSDIKDTQELPVYKLFHGTVTGSINYNGTINKENAKYPSRDHFVGYDGVLLGHIHKYQMLSPHMFYVGSLIQQNYGESIDKHGTLVWNVENKSTEFIEIENDYVFINIDIKSGEYNVDLLDKYKDKHIRLRCNITDTFQHTYANIQEEFKRNYNIQDIKTNKLPVRSNNSLTTNTPIVNLDDNIELSLINKHCDEELRKDVIDTHNKYKLGNSTTNLALLSSTWNIISLEFQNMFIYGRNCINQLDFVSGVYNICAPNTAGKTSIVNIILFALFDQISIGATKKIDIVYKDSTCGYVKIKFSCNNNLYVINKRASRHNRDGKEGYDFSIDFTQLVDGDTVNLNGTDKIKTQKAIVNVIGEFDTFINHNLMSTRLNTSVLNMSQSSQLKHFHSICDTNIYKTYVEQCKKDKIELEAKLNMFSGELRLTDRLVSGINYETEKQKVDEFNINIKESKSVLELSENECRQLCIKRDTMSVEIAKIQMQINDNIIKPPYERIYIDQQRTLLLQDINNNDIDGTLSLTIRNNGYTKQSVQRTIDTYNKLIVEIPHGDEIDDKLMQINIKINEHNKNKPTISVLSHLLSIMCRTEINIKELESRISSLQLTLGDFIEETVDIDEEELLKEKLSKLTTKRDEILSFCNKYNISINIIYNSDNNNLISEDISELYNLLTNATYKLKECKNLPMQMTDKTVDELNKLIQEEYKVNDKYFINMSTIDSLKSTINTLKCETEDIINSTIDINNKDNLIQLKDSLEKQIYKLRQTLLTYNISEEFIFSSDFKVKLRNIVIDDNKLDSYYVIKQLITENISKINIIESEIQKLVEKGVVDTDLSLETLCNMLQSEIKVNNKLFFNETNYINLTNELELLSKDASIVDYSYVEPIFNNLTYDANSNIIIKPSDLDLLRKFVISVKNNSYNKYVNLCDKLMNLQQIMNYNEEVDKQQQINNAIIEHNNNIHKQMRYIEVNTKINEKKQLIELNNKYGNQLNYLENKVIVEFIDKKEEYNKVIQDITEIDKIIIRNDKLRLLSELELQLQQLLNLCEINNQIDNIIKTNEEIRLLNKNINEQINYMKYNLLSNQIKTLQNNINYINNNKITELNMTNQHIELVNISSDKINKHKLAQLINTLKLEYDLAKQTYQQYLIDKEWFNIECSLFTEKELWISYSNIAIDNNVNKDIIEYNIKLLNLLEKLTQLDMYNEYLQTYDNIDKNNTLLNILNDWSVEFTQLSKNINDLNSKNNSSRTNLSIIQNIITESTRKVLEYEKYNTSLIDIKTNISSIEHNILVCKKYIDIFSPSKIPFDLLNIKFTSFDDIVNNIFSRYTKYLFKSDRTESNKLLFTVVNKYNGVTMNSERLSGFESIILNIAINQATLSLSSRFKCELMIIDESFDCIDSSRFMNELPGLIEIILQYYQTMIIISHRDIPSNVVDKNIKINTFNGTYMYSTINTS